MTEDKREREGCERARERDVSRCRIRGPIIVALMVVLAVFRAGTRLGLP